ncbi:GNAT family N-acetyltransferase [Desulfobacterium sp. N47]|uniref:N-acetyltransferase domain-containing protein n=1 Tax=uncultured Desulfobacterium sp. TaxID=201089 RepID=E1YBC6_9BACT|nr:hypothetical protein N47_C18610 [uncultured Desulfobacterium sp.]
MKIYFAENEKDPALIESLAKEIWIEHFTPIVGKPQVEYMLDKFQSKKAISEQIDNAGYLYYIIEDGDEKIGYFAFVPQGRELFLSKIYVKSSGRKKGHGKKATQFIVSFCKENGLDNISLTVNKNNTTSIKFYEKMGFKNTGSLMQDIGNGFVMDDYKMEKNILPDQN